jgi:two-component system KDP operon response regulator KdpE
VKILIVDDDPRIREALVTGLQLQWQDAQVLEAADGEAGLEQFSNADPDIVPLDITMLRMSGFEVLKQIRLVSDVPVILLTARGEEMDQVRGLELGVDDYLVKPIKHAALMARIKAVLRRAELPPPTRALPDFVAGELAVNFQAQQVTIGGEPVKLTPIEYKLLYQLVRNAGHLLPHRALLDRVWGSEYNATPQYLKVFISRLRAKLRRPGGPDYIQTERGLGYRFVKPSEPSTHHLGDQPDVGNKPQPVVWLAVDRIDPSPATRNSRRIYDQARLRELALDPRTRHPAAHHRGARGRPLRGDRRQPTSAGLSAGGPRPGAGRRQTGSRGEPPLAGKPGRKRPACRPQPDRADRRRPPTCRRWPGGA